MKVTPEDLHALFTSREIMEPGDYVQDVMTGDDFDVMDRTKIYVDGKIDLVALADWINEKASQ